MSLLADVVNFFFDGERVQTRQRQAQKQTDSAVECHERVSEGALDHFGATVYGGGIGNAPMRGHGLARPDGAGFLRGIVADGKYEVHARGRRLCEFAPTLAPRAVGWDMREFQLFQSFRTYDSCRIASRTVRRESGLAFTVENSLRHDGSR